VKRKGRWCGSTIRSLPRGISSLATRPSPLEESSCVILTARCTKPPSLVTHLMRSGGWGTNRDADVDAHVSGRNWLSEHITVFPVAIAQISPNSSYETQFTRVSRFPVECFQKILHFTLKLLCDQVVIPLDPIILG